MAEAFDTLDIEPQGSDFAIVHVNPEGRRHELVLSENLVVALARMIPQAARRIRAGMAPNRRDIALAVAVHPKSLDVKVDLHKSTAIVRVVDEWEADFDFALTALQAREFAKKLLARAEQIENAATTKQ